MSDIEQLRLEMDQITLDMIRLFQRRTHIAKEIGKLKQNIGRGVTDYERENQLLYDVKKLCQKLGMEESLGVRMLSFLLGESVRVQSEKKPTHLSIFKRAKELESCGQDIIHMEVGEPDFEAPDAVRNLMPDIFDRGYVRYGSAYGRPEFREALSKYATTHFGTHVPPENVMATPGGRFAVFLAVSLLRPGDEIIVIEPAWPAYEECARHIGAKVRTVKTDMNNKWEPALRQIQDAVSSNTGMIVLNYPNNPTGKILPHHLLDGIMEIAAENNLYVLSDEIYWQYADGWKSVLTYGYEKSIVVQSFSKSHAMTGFRVGYVMAASGILEAMAKLQALSLTSVAEPVQYAAMRALDADAGANSDMIKSRLHVLAEKAQELGLEFVMPQGAMYLFARVNDDDGTALAERLLEHGVAVAPGEAFGDYRNYIRISACQNEKKLIKGMNIINDIRDKND